MEISLAITTVISQCVGAGDYKQTRYYTKKIMIIIYLCIVLTDAILFVYHYFSGKWEGKYVI